MVILVLSLIPNLNGMIIVNTYVVSKATKCLNCLRRAMFGCTQEAKINAYKALV